MSWSNYWPKLYLKRLHFLLTTYTNITYWNSLLDLCDNTKTNISNLKVKANAWGTPSLWCGIWVGTSQGILSCCGTLLARGMCGYVSEYPASKISLGLLWIWRLCSYSPYFSSFTENDHTLLLFFNNYKGPLFGNILPKCFTKWHLNVDVPLKIHSFIR